MHVEVNDPRDKQVLSRAYGSQGRVSKTFFKMSNKNARIKYYLVYLYLTFAWRAPNLLDVKFYKLELVRWQTSSPPWSSGRVFEYFHFLIINNSKVGEDKEGYKEIADREKLTELQLRVRQLLDQVQQIQKEQNFQRFREERFRHTSESTNAKVFWWAAVQVIEKIFWIPLLTSKFRFLFWLELDFGKWNIWRDFSKPRNSSRPINLIQNDLVSSTFVIISIFKLRVIQYLT